MFASNVPEKLIQARTGHRSLESLRLYERPSDEQHQAVSDILTTGKRQAFMEVQNTLPNNCYSAKQLCYYLSDHYSSNLIQAAIFQTSRFFVAVQTTYRTWSLTLTQAPQQKKKLMTLLQTCISNHLCVFAYRFIKTKPKLSRADNKSGYTGKLSAVVLTLSFLTMYGEKNQVMATDQKPRA